MPAARPVAGRPDATGATGGLCGERRGAYQPRPPPRRELEPLPPDLPLLIPPPEGRDPQLLGRDGDPEPRPPPQKPPPLRVHDEDGLGTTGPIQLGRGT